MITYALFEVSAKKWLVPAGDTAPVANSLRGLGMIGVHTLLWMWYVYMLTNHTACVMTSSVGHLSLFCIIQELKYLHGLPEVSSNNHKIYLVTSEP